MSDPSRTPTLADVQPGDTMNWSRGFGPGSRRSLQVVVTRTTPARIIIEQNGAEVAFNRNNPHSGGRAKEIGYKVPNGFSFLELTETLEKAAATAVEEHPDSKIEAIDDSVCQDCSRPIELKELRTVIGDIIARWYPQHGGEFVECPSTHDRYCLPEGS